MKFLDLGTIIGLMEKYIKGNGKIIK